MHLVPTLALALVLASGTVHAQDVPNLPVQVETVAHVDLSTTPNIVADPLPSTPKYSEQDKRCLQKNIYFEARGEGVEGMKAVAAVTMNRVKSERFKPKTVCGIVNQRAGKVCQFSWVCAGLSKITDAIAWERAGVIAHSALVGNMVHKVGKALFFHNKSVGGWGKKPTAIIGNHIFYH